MRYGLTTVLFILLFFNVRNAFKRNVSFPKAAVYDASIVQTFADLVHKGILKSPVGVSFKGTQDYENVFTTNESFALPGLSLKFASNDMIAVPVSSFEMLKTIKVISSSERQQWMNNLLQSPFYQFVKKNYNLSFQQINDSVINKYQMDFLNQYNVEFAVLANGSDLPPQMNDAFNLLAKDKASGTSYYLRKSIYQKYLRSVAQLNN